MRTWVRTRHTELATVLRKESEQFEETGKIKRKRLSQKIHQYIGGLCDPFKLRVLPESDSSCSSLRILSPVAGSC